MNDLLQTVLQAILVSAILGLFFLEREERLKKTIEEEFNKRDKFFDVRFNFKLRALEEVLAPVKLQLMRSKVTLEEYGANDKYREKILKECNEKIRDLLLEKGHLIPLDLMPATEKFISHYDEWLQTYRETREIKKDNNAKHVFTYDFPHDAKKEFDKKYNSYRKELEIEGSLA